MARQAYFYRISEGRYVDTEGDPVALGYVKVGERLGKPIYTKPELVVEPPPPPPPEPEPLPTPIPPTPPPEARTYTADVWRMLTPHAQEELKKKYAVEIIPKPREPLEARKYTREAWAMVDPETQVRMATEYNIQIVTLPVIKPVTDYSKYATYPTGYVTEVSKAIEAWKKAEAEVTKMSIAPELMEAEIKALAKRYYEELIEPVEPVITPPEDEEPPYVPPYEPPEVVVDPFVPTYTQPSAPPVHVPTEEELARMLEIAEAKRVTTEELGKIPGEITSTEAFITSQEVAKGETKEGITAMQEMITDIRAAPDITFNMPDNPEASRSEAITYLNKQLKELEDMQQLVKSSPTGTKWNIPGKPSTTKSEALKYLSDGLSDVKKSLSDVKKTPDVSWDVGTKKGLSRTEAVAYLIKQIGESEKILTSIKKGITEAGEYLVSLPGYKAELKVYESELWKAEFGKMELPPTVIKRAYATPEEQAAAARLGIYLPTEYEPLSVSEAVYGAVTRLAEPIWYPLGLVGLTPEFIGRAAALTGVSGLETSPVIGAIISGVARRGIPEIGVPGFISPGAEIGLFGAEAAPSAVSAIISEALGAPVTEPVWAQGIQGRTLGLMGELVADVVLGKAAAITYKAGLKVAAKIAKRLAKIEPAILRPITARIAPGIYETSIELKKTLLGKPLEARFITRVTDIVTPETKLILSESIGVAEVPRFLRIGKKKIPLIARAIGVAEEVTPDITRLRALGLAGKVGVEAPFISSAEVRKLMKPIEVWLEPLPEVIREAKRVIGVKYYKGIKLADYAQETVGFVRVGKTWDELLAIGEEVAVPFIKKIEPASIPKITKRTKKTITELYKKGYYTKKTYDSLIKKVKAIGELTVDKVPKALHKIADKFERLKAYDEAIQLRRVAEGIEPVRKVDVLGRVIKPIKKVKVLGRTTIVKKVKKLGELTVDKASIELHKIADTFEGLGDFSGAIKLRRMAEGIEPLASPKAIIKAYDEAKRLKRVIEVDIFGRGIKEVDIKTSYKTLEAITPQVFKPAEVPEFGLKRILKERIAKKVKVKPKPYYGLIGEYTPEAARFLEKTVLPEFIPEVVKKIDSKTISKRVKKSITELYKKEYYTKKTYDSLIKAAKRIADLPVDKVPRELGKIADRFERLKAYDEAIKLRQVVEGAKAYLAEVSAVAAVKTLMEPTIIKPSIIPKPPKLVKPGIRVKEVDITMPTREGQLMIQRTLVTEKVKVEPAVKVKPGVKVKPRVKIEPAIEQLRRTKEGERIGGVSGIMQEQLQEIKTELRVKVMPAVEQLKRTKELVMVSPMVMEMQRVRVDVKVKPAVRVRVAELLKPSMKLREITMVKPPTPVPPVRFPWGLPWLPPLMIPIRRRKKVKRIPIREELRAVGGYQPSITAVYERITVKEPLKQTIFAPIDIRPIVIKEKKVKKKPRVRVRIRDILKPSIKFGVKAPKKGGIREALKPSIKF